MQVVPVRTWDPPPVLCSEEGRRQVSSKSLLCKGLTAGVGVVVQASVALALAVEVGCVGTIAVPQSRSVSALKDSECIYVGLLCSLWLPFSWGTGQQWLTPPHVRVQCGQGGETVCCACLELQPTGQEVPGVVSQRAALLHRAFQSLASGACCLCVQPTPRGSRHAGLGGSECWALFRCGCHWCCQLFNRRAKSVCVCVCACVCVCVQVSNNRRLLP